MRKSKARNTRKIKAQPAPLKAPASQKAIDERLASAAQGELRDIVYIGELVEKVLLGEFGSVLRALMKGRAAMELNESRVTAKVSADRYLGRLDAYERILSDLEQYVLDKDFAFKKILEDRKTEREMEEEIQHAPEVGIVENS